MQRTLKLGLLMTLSFVEKAMIKNKMILERAKAKLEQLLLQEKVGNIRSL